MSRMMPARIRAEGAELFDKGLMTDVSVSGMKLSADVDGEQVVYDLDGQNDLCFCDVFQRNKRYCQHIAAVEEYLKKADIEAVEEEKKAYEAEVEKSKELQASADFLAKVNEDKWANQSEKMILEVEVSDPQLMESFYYSGNFLAFTFKIRLSTMSRSYIIKDIPHFITLLRKGGTYLIGSSHYVTLMLSHFDKASQDFLSYLLKITPSHEEMALTNLFRKLGRYFVPHAGLLPELLALTAAMDFSMKISEKPVRYFSVLPLDDEGDLYQFEVKPLDDVIELTIKEMPHQTFFDGEIIYRDHVFYQLDAEQLEILNLLSKVPMATDDLRMIHFDYDDKDKLAQALQIFEKLGYVDAPSAFKIRPFKPQFSFDLDGS